MLINCKKFRETKLLDKFIYYLGIYDFIVTQDEDYLNLICKDDVLWLDQKWNTELTGNLQYSYDPSEANVLHYIMVNKPWHYKDCRCADIFWQYAEQTSVYEALISELEGYTDEQRANDTASSLNLAQIAREETAKEDNFLNVWGDKLPLV